MNLLEPILERWERRIPTGSASSRRRRKTGYAPGPQKNTLRAPSSIARSISAGPCGRAMRRIRPTLLVLAELELWPNLIAAAKRHGAKSPSSTAAWARRAFAATGGFAWLVAARAQPASISSPPRTTNTPSGSVALARRSDAVQVTGSIKFDGARTSRDSAQTRRLADLAGISPRRHRLPRRQHARARRSARPRRLRATRRRISAPAS